jgi:ABC-type uncharacterized transport system YnjBCD ATPase subunit
VPFSLACGIGVGQSGRVPLMRSLFSVGRFVLLAAAGVTLFVALQSYSRTGWAGGWLIVSCLLTLAASITSIVLRRTSPRSTSR